MQLRQVVGVAGGELRSLRAAARTGGGRAALVARARSLLGVDDLLARTEALGDESTAMRAATSALQDEVATVRAEEGVTRTGLQGTQGLLHAGLDMVDRRYAEQELRALVEPTTEWVRRAQLDTGPLLSVVLATRDRAELLTRAVASVQAQAYANWELVVVDDGSTDATPGLLAGLAAEDDRIVVVPHARLGVGTAHARLGVGAARNAGLSAARGEFVCYLDDDNLMQPLWLRAVAWAMARRPDIDLFYGARLTDPEPPDTGPRVGLPFLHFETWDRQRLEVGNFIDLGVVAHRRNLPEAIFDEHLEMLVDWDLVLRLTAHREPLALPVVASLYTTSAPLRLSRTGDRRTSEAAVRAKLLASRPLRVLAYNSLFPLVPETYIAEEMHALADNGSTLAWCTERLSTSPVPLTEPLYTDLDEAVAGFRPDVLFLYWTTFAGERLDVLSRVGLPFGVRVHSFDFDLDAIARVRSHPLCVGVWSYPHHADQAQGTYALVPLLNDREAFPPEEERTIVLSASAGLPKKDWPILVYAFAELARRGVDCRIVVGTTYLHEDEPRTIRQLIDESGAPVTLSVDVPHDEVIALLGRTAAVVYTKVPGGPMGMPRSIVEGMYAGTSVVMPDRPESLLTAGPDCRTYVNSADIVGHVTEILAGGPSVDAERAANRSRARCQFADPVHGATFASELTKALAEWRAG
jgi:glycosyltransferase involved in cell wall biosynthesis